MNILISIGFYLILERKLIGLIHFRLGPNKILFLGLLQFLLDLVKLILKENLYIYLFKFNYLLIILFILLIRILF